MKFHYPFTQVKVLILVFAISLLACNKNDISSVNNATINKAKQVVQDDMSRFAQVLSTAVSKSSELRNFIKKKALEQVDNDYDVFYHFVKDEQVANGKTFRDMMLEAATNKDSFSYLENNLPLATIYVPELPSGFNAQKWNTGNEIPAILAYTPALQNQKDIPYFSKTGIFTLKPDEIPGFPTLVVKNNERITMAANKVSIAGAQQSLTKTDYKFTDAAYSNTMVVKKLSNVGGGSKIAGTPPNPPNIVDDPKYANSFQNPLADPMLATAYAEMGADGYNWQRDNIYYGLTKTDTTGPLNKSIGEYIYRIKFSVDALNKMSDQTGDPKTNTNEVGPYPLTSGQFILDFWTDGKFEFKIDALISDITGLGTTVTKYFSASPISLFGTSFTERTNGSNYYYKVTRITPQYFYPAITLPTWDIQSRGYSWKFIISEQDPSETVTRTETSSTEFAANFSFDMKIGLKFGASAKTTNTSTFTISTTSTSDDLGTVEAYFSDPVIVPGMDPVIWRPSTNTKLYEVGNPYVTMALLPKKLY